jgi:hypothetical protein
MLRAKRGSTEDDTYAQLIAAEGQAVSDIGVPVVMNALAHMLATPKSRERVYLK